MNDLTKNLVLWVVIAVVLWRQGFLDRFLG